MELTGKVAVVTGAARGMGQEIVKGLLAEGCRVVALDRSWQSTGLSNDTADAFARSLDGNDDALLETLDLRDTEAVQACRARALARFGAVDILVNNAGMRMREVDPSTYNPILTSDLALWQQMFDTNVLGPVRLIQAFAPAMIARGGGSIINVSSGSGTTGRPGDNPYGASKAALTNLSQSLAGELREQNVAVSVVLPAGTRTTGFTEQRAKRREVVGGVQGPALLPTSIVPLIVWLATQGMAVSGQQFEVASWLEAHGLGPRERWQAAE